MIVAGTNHVKIFPIDTSVTPATFGSERKIMTVSGKLESNVMIMPGHPVATFYMVRKYVSKLTTHTSGADTCNLFLQNR